MILVFSAALALSLPQQSAPGARRAPPVVRDSSVDTTVSRGGRRNRGIRRQVTAEDQRTAFKDDVAKSMLLRARVARMTMDSSLKSYDAMSYSRLSAGMSLLKIGRDRLIFRHEAAARVQWQQGVGVWMEARGRRTAIPSAPKEARDEIRQEMDDPDMNAAIPYFPGAEPLWVGTSMARAQVNEREIVNPIADGAEAYYTYETGDSARFTLPNNTVIQLREIRFRPREPKWNLAVGSLWFDTKSAQVVRAAYRLSIPMDIWAVATADNPKSMDDVPAWVKPMITPMKAEVSAIAVEYGLHEGRFWLPRLRFAEGSAQVSFMRIPFKMEQSFKYSSVNANDTLPAILLAGNAFRARMPDSLSPTQQEHWRDSVNAAVRARAVALRDSIRRGLRQPTRRVSPCDTSTSRIITSTRGDADLRIALRVPCDLSTLENSPDLPKSIYDPGEELFSMEDLEELKKEALSLSAQAPFSVRLHFLPPPSLSYGLPMMRYNRVEGLSFGASVEQQFGGGYSGLAVGRFGLADHEPNLDLTITRTNLTDAIHLSAYNHLVSASDWGHPLSFGSSFSALFFGRDEGFYYRATGLSFSGGRESSFGGGTRVAWSTFVERQRSAASHTTFAVNGADFPDNLLAQRGTYTGASARASRDYGLDPRGLRMLSEIRVEAAYGDSSYGRAAAEVTTSHGLGALLAASVTVSGGSSIGGLPSQRRWYLGGSQTVRGQSPDTAQSGNAYWLARAELGSSDAGLRPTVFADLGWVGDRTKLSEVGRPMSGVGAGVSVMDGLFRFDIARGLYPRKQYRVDLYLESKF